MMFFDCPAYGGDEGTTRCALPAEVEYRYTVQSTDGPLESAKVCCPRGHWFNGPIEYLTVAERCITPEAQAPTTAATHLTARRSTTGARS